MPQALQICEMQGLIVFYLVLVLIKMCKILINVKGGTTYEYVWNIVV